MFIVAEGLLNDHGQSTELFSISVHFLFVILGVLKIKGFSSITTTFNFEDHFVPSGFFLEFPGHTIFDLLR